MLRFNIIFIVLICVGHGGFAQNFYISGGHDFSTALCSDGKLLVWGSNAKNELGPNPGPDPTIPSEITIPSNIRQVDAGSGSLGIAVGCTGEVWTWGDIGAGQRGAGTGGTPGIAPNKVVGLNGSGLLSNVKYVNASTDCAYAILANGDLVSWGNNGNGQLGTGNSASSSFPVNVMTSTGILKNAIQVEGGDYGGYALVDPDGDGKGTVYSWGANSGGVLGRDITPTPANVAGQVIRADNGQVLDNIVSISAGDKHCLAIDANGNLWSWGDNAWQGQTGSGKNGKGAPYAEKVVGGETGDLFLSNVVAIAGGQSFSLAVLASGEVVAFGGMNVGPAWVDSDVPVYLKDTNGKKITGIQSVSDGDFWGFLISQKGELFSIGNNDNGVLGIGGTTGSLYPVPLALKTCTAADPCPVANLGENKVKCPSDVMTLYAGSYSVNYTYTWTVNGVAQSPILGAAGATFKATELGTYKVSITSPKVNTCGESCKAAEDEVIITAPTPPPTPTANYCNGNVFPYYGTLNSKFKWYASPGGNVELGTGPNASSFPSTGLTSTGTKDANNDDILLAYVEDVSGFKGKVGPARSDFSAGTISQIDPNSITIPKQISLTFDALNTFTLDSMTLGFGAYSSQGLQTVKINIKNSAGTIVGTSSVLVNNIAGGTTFSKVYIGIKVPKGIGYTIDAVGTDKDANIVWYSDGPANWFPKTYTLNGQDVAGNFKNSFPPGYAGWSTPAFFDWIVTSENYYQCGRIPVKITKQCPACEKPTSFIFSSDAKEKCATASGGITISVGLVSPTAPTTTPTNYIYQWYKNNVPLSDIAQTQKSITTFPGATYGSGVYKVRVAHKDATEGSGCYVDSSVTITFQDPVLQPSIADKDIICAGATSVKTFGGASLPTGGVKPYDYQWQSSADGVAYVDIAGAISQSYKPGAPAATTYYKRTVKGGLCGVSASDSAFITVIPTVIPGAISTPLSQICQNNTPVLTESVKASGGTPANYVYTWFIDSSFTPTPVWKKITPSNSTDLPNASKLGGIGTYKFIRVVQSDICGDTTDPIEVKTIPGMDPGYISTSQVICYNGNPKPIVDSVKASGGTIPNATYSYQWQESTDPINFTDIPGQTDPTKFTPGLLTADRYYRRFASVNGSSSQCDKGPTPIVAIKVYAPLNPGTLKSTDALCAGAEVTTQSLTPFSGGSSNKTYQWQTSATGSSPWTDVPGATAENFNTGKLTTTVFYQRLTKDLSCGDTSTAAYKISINPLRNPKITSLLPNGDLCELDKNIPFTADTTGAGANGIFSWLLNDKPQKQSTGKTIQLSDWTPPTSTIKVTISPDRTSYPCYGPDHDTLITVKVTGKQTPKVTLSTLAPFCEGESITLTATTAPAFNSTTDQLVWKVGGVVIATAANKLQFTNATLTDKNEISVEYTSGSKCAITPLADTSLVVKVYEKPVASIKSDAEIICLGDTLPLIALGDFTTLNPDTTYQWYLDGTAIAGAKHSIFNAQKSGSYTVEISNGGICKSTSNAVPLEVQNPGVNAGPDQNILNGQTATLLASTTGNYSYSISWSPQDSIKLDPANLLQPAVNPSRPTLYTITVTTAEGCQATDQVKVNVFLPITIPNAFSPNNDGLNDTWVIDGLETYPEAEIRVFNRWGSKVFEAKGYQEIQQWKGTTNDGSQLPVAVYYFVIDPRNENGGETKTGFIAIVR